MFRYSLWDANEKMEGLHKRTIQGVFKVTQKNHDCPTDDQDIIFLYNKV